MKRLRRIIFNALTSLSLLLCVATIVLWVQSYAFCDRLLTPLPRWAFDSYRGKIAIWYGYGDQMRDVRLGATGWAYEKGLSEWEWEQWFDSHGRSRWRLCGICFIDLGLASGFLTVTGVPHWMLAVLFAAIPLLRMRLLIKTRRSRKRGLCPVCSYDLRATLDRCPECGMVPMKVKA